MSFQIETRVEPAYVVVTCSGPYSLDAFLHLIETTFEAAAEAQRSAAFVDLTGVTGTPPTTMDRFEIGVSVAEHHHNPLRIAAVGAYPMIDPSRFAQVVANNRGARLKVCVDNDEALAWLEKGTDPAPSPSAN